MATAYLSELQIEVLNYLLGAKYRSKEDVFSLKDVDGRQVSSLRDRGLIDIVLIGELRCYTISDYGIEYLQRWQEEQKVRGRRSNGNK